MEKYELWLEEWKKSATLANDREDLAIAEEAARVYTKSSFRATLSRTIELRKQLAHRRYVDPADICVCDTRRQESGLLLAGESILGEIIRPAVHQSR